MLPPLAVGGGMVLEVLGVLPPLAAADDDVAAARDATVAS